MNFKYLTALLSGPLSFILVNLIFDFSVVSPQATMVIGVATWMVIWWVTEAIPIPVTALLPIILFPMLGIFDIKTATMAYASPIIFLFMGGFMIALGIEKSNLHTRIALHLINFTGTTPSRIVMGFMLATALLSMWLSNTATTVMMLPMGISVIDQLTAKAGKNEKSMKFFAVALMLSIAYAANIGGTATIIGTPPNLVMVGLMKDLYGIEVHFAQWLLIGFPFAFIMLALTYYVLVKFIFRLHTIKLDVSKNLLHDRLLELGKLKKEEKLVIGIFLVTAFSWIFKANVNAWLNYELLNDSTTAILGGALMFTIPSDLKKKRAILKWSDTKKLPWGILILFGGGITLAKGLQQAEIIDYIGNTVAQYSEMNWLLIGFILVLVMLFATELMSNVALTTISIPVVAGIGLGMFNEPLLFVIPVTLAASCAFMLPIATPPNAIVFSSGHITMKQMIKAGFWLNIIAVLVISFIITFIVKWLY